MANNYTGLLLAMGRGEDEIRKALTELAQRFGVDLAGVDPGDTTRDS